MKAFRVVTLFVAMATALVVVSSGGLVGAADPTVEADWQMNESSSATTLADSSGNGVTGSIGATVDTGVRSGSTTYHRFPPISATAPADPGRLHVVSDDPGLDPGSDTFAVTVRFRAGYTGRNMIQKGQSTTVGGMWKIEFEGVTGRARCLFRGPDSDSLVSSDGNTVDDGWHILRCEHSATGTIMTLDGVRQARSTRSTGPIANNKDLVIGGKGNCDNITTSCDYFVGDLDYVTIERGGSTTTTTTSTTTSTTSTTVKPTTTTTTVKPTTTTTTVKPTTTTTTSTTVAPSSQLPVGRIDSIKVEGSTITVSGPASDPDGTPIARVTDVVEGRRTTIERWGSGGRFSVSYPASSGTHEVCVSLLDSPTRQEAPIGCEQAVVK